MCLWSLRRSSRIRCSMCMVVLAANLIKKAQTATLMGGKKCCQAEKAAVAVMASLPLRRAANLPRRDDILLAAWQPPPRGAATRSSRRTGLALRRGGKRMRKHRNMTPLRGGFFSPKRWKIAARWQFLASFCENPKKRMIFRYPQSIFFPIFAKLKQSSKKIRPVRSAGNLRNAHLIAGKPFS